MAANVPTPSDRLSISELKKMRIIYAAAVVTICAELARVDAPYILYILAICMATLVLQTSTTRDPGSPKS